MNYCDQPAPADCARCPLRVPLPDDLSDAAVAQLVESLYLIAAAIENRYYGRLRRHYAAPHDNDHRHDQAPPSATTLQDLSDDDDLPF